MKINSLGIILVLAIITNTFSSQAISQQIPTAQSQSLNEFLGRWNDQKYKSLLQSALWTVSHDYTEFKHVEEVLNTAQRYFEAIERLEKTGTSSLDKLGGIKAFKERLAEWLNDDDQAIRAFAAVLLGITGDMTYTEQLAVLLKDRESGHENLCRYDRGRAALALGLIGAKGYVSQLVGLLNSSNKYDRAGAAYGLGWLGTKGQEKAVAKLLSDEDREVREAAKQSLEMMGAAHLIN